MVTGSIDFGDNTPTVLFSYSWIINLCPGTPDPAKGEFYYQGVIAKEFPISHIYTGSGVYTGSVQASISGTMDICSIGLNAQDCPPTLILRGADLGFGPSAPFPLYTFS
jgi:hypothetical protein